MKKETLWTIIIVLAIVLISIIVFSATKKNIQLSPEDVCASDVNKDERINILDLIFIRSRMNQDVNIADNTMADVNKDGKINILDLIAVRNNLNQECKLNTEKVVLFKEEIKNKYFISSGECHPDGWCNNEDYVYFDVDSFITDFYKKYTDSYDFLIIAPQVMGLQNNFNRMITSSVEGIGLEKFNQSYKVLQSVTAIDLYRGYQAQLSNPNGISLDPTILNLIIFHEIAHQWCCYIDGLGNFNRELPGHWVNNLDLFSGNKTYGDIMGYYQWMKKDNEMICTDTNDESTEKVFSNLTLYLAGLLPKEAVSPIYLHKFQESDNDAYNIWGPTCYGNPNFTETEEITIQDIIDANGERVPNYESSQKDFVFKYVVVVPYDTGIDPNFINYVNLYLAETPSGWSKVTKNTSTAKVL